MTNRPKGLGDSIENFTRATGIKSLVSMASNAMGKKDCGCNKRKEALNKAFPYKTNKSKNSNNNKDGVIEMQLKK